MKKIVLCICLGISLFAESSCDIYLKYADKTRIKYEKLLLDDNHTFRSYEQIMMYLDYIDILQKRYEICKKYGVSDILN